MDIDDLNKTQIILLTLLVSFVTSIATGIVTVSLVEQAPPSFTQTVNRVVERTVEKVVPSDTPKPGTTVKETTVVVKEEDLLIKSIEKNQAALHALRMRAENADGTPGEIFLGWATLLSTEGVAATDLALLGEGNSYILEDAAGKRREGTVLLRDRASGLALIRITKVEGDKAVFAPVPFADASSVRLGQSVIAFGGRLKSSVSVGIVSSASKGEENASSTVLVLRNVDASINPPGGITGGPLTNIFGELVALSVSEGVGTSYAPVSALSALLRKL